MKIEEYLESRHYRGLKVKGPGEEEEEISEKPTSPPIIASI
jgi:hypothetical protein